MTSLEQGQRPTEQKSWDNTMGFFAELTFPTRELEQGREHLEPLDFTKYYPPIDSKNYYRNLEITGRYLGTASTGLLLAKDYGFKSRENIRQIVTKTVTDLYETAPEELKARYPFESLSLNKNGSFMYGRVGEIRYALSGEDLDFATLRQTFSSKDLNVARAALRRVGVEVPGAGIVERYKKLGDEESSDEQVQQMLGTITNTTTHEALLKAGLISPLDSTLRSGGLFPRPTRSDVENVYNYICEKGIPAGQWIQTTNGEDSIKILKYHVIVPRYASRILEAVKSAPEFEDLKRNPVEIIEGPKTSNIPSTNKLKLRDGYRSVSALIAEIIGKGWTGNYLKLTRGYIVGSPVDIFHSSNRIMFAEADIDELRPFLEKRLKEEGLL